MNKKYVIAGLCLAFGASVFAEQILVRDAFNVSSVSETGMTYSKISNMGAVAGGAWQAQSGTGWGIGGGSVTNSDLSGSNLSEGALARVVDISSITDTSLNELKLDLNFTTANAGEKLYVHMRGYILGTAPADGAALANIGAKNGATWNDALVKTDWTIYNLNTGVLNDHASDYSGGTAAVLLTDGVAGAHTFSQTFDMSGYAAAANDIAGFDYLGIYITRNLSGTDSAVSIDEITVTAIPEPGTLGLISAVGIAILFVRRRLVL